MKNLFNKQKEQAQNESSSNINFTNKNTLEVLNKYEMKQIKGGEGEDDDNANWK